MSIKYALAANWFVFAFAFCFAELFNWTSDHWQLALLFVFWFLVVELYQAFRRGENGGTLSEVVWWTQMEGYHFSVKGVWIPARLFPAWLFTIALCLRVAGTSRVLDGQHPDDLPYIFDHAPLDFILVGVVLWLVFHFYSGGDKGHPKDSLMGDAR